MLQVLGLGVSTGDSTVSNIKSFEAFVLIYLSITIINYRKLVLNNKIIAIKKNYDSYLTGSTVV
jgi:hypothetical protein